MSIGMFKQPTIAKDAVVAVLCILLFQIALGLLVLQLLRGVESKLADERHRVAVISSSNRIANLTQKLGLLFVVDRSKNLHYSLPDTERWQSLSLRLDNEFRHLRGLAIGDQLAEQILQEQEKISRAADQTYRKELDASNGRKALDAARLVPSSLVLSSDVSGPYQELLRRYKVVLSEQSISIAETSSIVKQVFFGTLLVELVLTLTIFALFFRHLVVRLSTLTLNFQRYHNNEPLQELVSPQDELGKLDKLFREMIQTLENSARYETTLIEGALDVIFRLDGEGRIRDINAAAVWQWGYQPSELEGAPWQIIVAAESRQGLLDFLSLLPKQEHPLAIEVAVKRNDASIVASRFSCYWSEADLSTFCFVSDIGAAKGREDQLRESENDVRMLMRNLPIGLLVVDESGTFLSTNERIEQMLEAYSSSLERNIDAVFAEVGLLAKARNSSQLRTCIGGRQSNSLICELTIAELGSSNGTLVVVEDVSEKAKLETLRRDFLQLLWRNLGEPIMKVKETLLALDLKTEKEQSRVRKFVLNANRLLRLLDELLRLEELAPGRLVGAMVPTKVSDLAESAVASLADYALNQSIKLEVELIPVMVRADFERVVQVLINLISNAIKFSFKDGTVLLQISLTNDQVEFSVIDSGRGVPLAKQAVIFQAYGQASRSDARTGTGLGLAICRSIVEAHGGSIGVESREGGGSRFWFRLPRLEVPLE